VFDMKKFLSFLLAAALLAATAVPAFAADTLTRKEEVVYGLLELDGSVGSVYVVNSFQGKKITDYGNYGEISNMTSSEKITRSGDKITVNTASDRLYYQGTLQTKELPWNIAIRYTLDGKDTPAAELGGKSGALEIAMAVTRNEAVNPAFCDNYMLQVTLTLDTDKCAQIESPNATVANAGKNKVIAHTVLPGSDANIVIKAKVNDFAMDGFQITAMPLAAMFEMPDTDSLTEKMTVLTDAVSALNEGVKKLSEGVSQTDSGARELAEGSSQFESGLSELSGNADSLLDASAQINSALIEVSTEIEKSLGSLSFVSGIQKLKDGMALLSSNYQQFHEGLGEYMGGVKQLADGYGDFDAGLQALSGGLGDIDTGTKELYGGTSRLNGAVAGLPDTIRVKIDEMLKQYDKSDYKTVSFVSEKNTNVNAVQFVIKTPPVEKSETPVSIEPVPVKLTLWQKILKLFGLYP